MGYLTTLNLTSNNLDSYAIINILKNLHGSNVSKLVLDKNKKIGKAFVKSVFKLLKMPLEGKGGDMVSDRVKAVDVFPGKLTFLSLNEMKLCDSGTIELGHRLLKFKLLTTLNLRENDCTHLSTLSLGAYLNSETCPLLHLDLSWNNIRTEGAIKILQSISNNSQSRLQTLNLDW